MADFNPSIYAVGTYYDISVTPSGGWINDGGDTVVVGFSDGAVIWVDRASGTIIKIKP